ncbi:MAG: hypothetical protein ABJ251_22935 [Paracoccaceae bacterium]
MSLRPIGQLFEADKNGQLPRIGRPPHSSWKPILGDLKKQIQGSFFDNRCAIVIRGSVARGASIDDAADLDLVVLFDRQAALPDQYQSPSKPELKIETSFIPLADLSTDSRWVWMRFMLAHNGYTIFGPDILTDLPEPTLGPHCFAHLRNADKWLAAWETYWDQDKDHLAICEWLMKRIVRSLFESQMMRINAFSRDIYPCAEVAMKAFPAQRELILRAAELAVEPVEEHRIVSAIVKPLSEVLYLKQAELKRSIS